MSSHIQSKRKRFSRATVLQKKKLWRGKKMEVEWGRGVAEINAKLPEIAPSTIFFSCQLLFLFLSKTKLLKVCNENGCCRIILGI